VTVLNRISLRIDPTEVVLALHHGKRAPEELVAEAHTTLKECQGLLEPRAVYEWIEVRGVKGEYVLLKSPNDGQVADLRLGKHADLMSKARRALVSVATIGDRLEGFIEHCNEEGDILRAYLADSIGVVALAQVGEAIRHLAEHEALSLGWGVSPSLAPGSLLGWPLTGQRDLCSLVRTQQIGVTLSENGVLKPFRSVSSMIGIGPGYTDKKVGSICRYCSRAENCWTRS